MTAQNDKPTLRLYTVEEVSELLGTSKTFVYERIRAGEIPTVNLGTGIRPKIRVRSDDFEKYIDSRTNTTS